MLINFEGVWDTESTALRKFFRSSKTIQSNIANIEFVSLKAW